jgi:hypothetical protein
MSKRRPTKGTNDRRPDGRANNRPPLHTRFKPGQSGNLSGRPKGSKSTGALVVSTLNQKVTINIGGKTQRISLRHAMIIKTVEDCMKRGNLKALAFLFQHYDAQANSSEDRSVHRREDEQMLEMLKTIIQNEGRDDGLS